MRGLGSRAAPPHRTVISHAAMQEAAAKGKGAPRAIAPQLWTPSHSKVLVVNGRELQQGKGSGIQYMECEQRYWVPKEGG